MNEYSKTDAKCNIRRMSQDLNVNAGRYIAQSDNVKWVFARTWYSHWGFHTNCNNDNN